MAVLVPVVAVPTAGASGTNTTADYLRLWASTAGGDTADQRYSTSQARDMARRFDLVVARPTTFTADGLTPVLRAENPGLKLIAYVNAVFVPRNAASLYPDDWYLRSAGGERVRQNVFGTYLMDFTRLEWRRHVVGLCRAAIRQSAADGCYLDDLAPGTLDATLTATPIDPRSGEAFNGPEWVAATSELAEYVNERLTGRFVLANGTNNGIRYFGEAAAYRLLVAADGAHAEGFLRGESTPLGQFRSEADWKQEIDMLTDAAGRRRTLVAKTKIWIPAADSQVERWRRYTYASFLLGADGTQYLQFSPVGPGRPPPRSSLDSIDIGTPVESYGKRSGVYQRRFSRGLVVVNPTPNTIRVNLDQRYLTLDGTVTNTLTFRPNTGQVLVARGGSAGSAPECMGVVATVVAKGSGASISGTSRADVIIGTAGNDVIDAGAGDDLVCAGSGNDVVNAGEGADRARGGDGADTLRGGMGPDVLAGGAGNDILKGDGGIDRLGGGPEHDSCTASVGKDTPTECEAITWLPG